MKILGLTCGRPLGNSEILTIEALMAAEEMGVEVELIRMHDLDVKPCKGCISCIKSYFIPGAKPGTCVIKDDVEYFVNKVYEADGVLLAGPLYTGMPPGNLKCLSDRLGPAVDPGFMKFAKDQGKEVDERAFNPRIGGCIACGGAVEAPEQLGIPILQESFFAGMMITVVDTFVAANISDAGAVLLKDDDIARARKLGQNMAKALGTPIDKVEFLGDDPGTCPVCHHKVLLVGNENPVICPTCGIKGELSIDENGKFHVEFDSEDIRTSRRTSIETRYQHLIDIGEWGDNFMSAQDEIKKRLEKYKKFDKYAKLPEK